MASFALNGEGVPVFSRLQAALDEGRTDQLICFAFDLLFLNGVSTAQLPLIKRKKRLNTCSRRRLVGCATANTVPATVLASTQVCKLGLEGAISKRNDRPHAPGDRGIWVKSK